MPLAAVHVTRIYAIYDRNRTVLALMFLLFGVQIVATAVCCAFFHCIFGSSLNPDINADVPILAVPLLDGQGCIAGPRFNWVGVYWIAPTLLYTVSVSFIPISFGISLTRGISVHPRTRSFL